MGFDPITVGAAVSIGSLLIGVGLAYFAKKPQQQSMSPSALEDFAITSSEEGTVVKFIRGRAKMVGIYWWYGNIDSVEITQEVEGGKGGGDTTVATGHAYYADIWQGLCTGPGVVIEKLYRQNKEIDNTGYTLNPGDETYFPTEPGEFAAALNPVAHVFFDGIHIGDNVSAIPTYHYLVLVESGAPLTYANMIYGVNPAALVYDILIEAEALSSEINLSTFQDAADYWYSKGVSLNFLTNEQNESRKSIKDIFTYVDFNMRQNDTDDSFELIAWKDTDVYSFELTDEDYKTFDFKRKSWENSDIYTDFVATFTDREQDYTKRTISVKNPAARRLVGRKNLISIDLTMFSDKDLASQRLWEIMKKESYPSASLRCTIPLKYHGIKEGHVVRINNTEYGITDLDFRVISVELSEIESNDIIITMEQELSTIFDSNYSLGGGSSWTEPDNSPQVPYNTSIFELPYNNDFGQNPAYLMLIARKGIEESFACWFSLDGADYTSKGAFTTFSQYGTLDSEYSADTYSIDDETGILYTPDREDPDFDSINRGNLFSDNRVVIIGNEMMAFQTVTPEGSNSIRLTGIIRGLLNTPIETHNAASDVWIARIGSNVLTGVPNASFRLKLSPQFGTESVSLALLTQQIISYAAKAVEPWGIFNGIATRSGSTVDVILNNSTQLLPGAGIKPSSSQPIIYPNDIDGVIEYYTSYDATVNQIITNLISLTQASVFALYIRQSLNGHTSDWEQLYIGALDGVHYLTGSQLTNSGLEKIKWGVQGWVDIMNRNSVRLNDDLLNVTDLFDVDDAGVVDADILSWDATSQKFIPSVTTTTSTTTTSSSSTTTITGTTTTITGTTTTITGTTTTITGTTTTITGTTTSSTSTTTSSTSTTTTISPVSYYTAKSVILDIADIRGGPFMNIRSIDFWYLGSKITMTSGFTAYATTTLSASYQSSYAFNTSLSKTGGYSNNSWLSNLTTTDERLIIVFDSSIDFDSIVVNNGHNSGTETNEGAKNVVINISTDAITDTTYGASISNSTEIFNGQFDEHIASDVVDDQELVLT